MTVEELGRKCKEIKVNCEICEHQKECSKLTVMLEYISPSSLLSILKEPIK